jgi:hypothetical protein
MSPKRRILVARLIAGLWACLVFGWVFHATADEPDDDSDELRIKLLLKADATLAAKLDGAEEQIKEKLWKSACLVLQSIVDQRDDSLVARQRTAADGKKELIYVGAKSEADRLIRSMPEEGRTFYRSHYAAKAQEQLEQAQESGDVALLVKITQRYLHTGAGFEAMTQLATHRLDRGENVMAALSFKTLMNLGGADKLPPLTLFKASLAFRYTGAAEEADAVWKQLKPIIEKDGLRLGNGKLLTLEEVDKLLDEAKPKN